MHKLLVLSVMDDLLLQVCLYAGLDFSYKIPLRKPLNSVKRTELKKKY